MSVPVLGDDFFDVLEDIKDLDDIASRCLSPLYCSECDNISCPVLSSDAPLPFDEV